MKIYLDQKSACSAQESINGHCVVDKVKVKLIWMKRHNLLRSKGTLSGVLWSIAYLDPCVSERSSSYFLYICINTCRVEVKVKRWIFSRVHVYV